MRRFELVEGSSSKFWEITLDGSAFTVRFGRIGTNGQTQEKSFPTADKAKSEHDKLVLEKTKKGYREVGALAEASAASPAAATAVTKRASAPKKKEAEAPEASEAPAAPVPAQVRVASAVVANDPTTWPAEYREELHPTPAFPGPRIALDRDAIWKRMRERAALSKVSQSKDLAAAFARLATAEAPSSTASTAVEMDVAHILCHLDHPWSDLRGLTSKLDLLVDHWVATGGLAAAMDIVFALKGTKHAWLNFAGATTTIRLAAHAAHASAEERATAYATAMKKHGGKSTAGHEMKRDSVIAYVFPEHGDGDRLVASPGTTQYGMPDVDVLAVAAITKLDSLVELAKIKGAPWLLSTGRTWRGASVEPTAFGFVARFGEGALDPLLAMLDTAHNNADVTRGLARAVGLVSTPRALSALASRMADKHVVAAMREAALRSPALALGPLAEAASARGATAQTARALLGQITREPIESVARAEAALPEGLRNVIAEVRAKGGGDREEASLDELPPVLASPPWLAKTKKAEPVVVANVPALAWPDAMKWRAGMREEWTAHRVQDWTNKWAADRAQLARSFGVTTEDLAKLEAGVAIAPGDREVQRYSLRADVLPAVSPALARGLVLLYAAQQWWGEDAPFKKLVADRELAVFDAMLSYARHHPVDGLPILAPYASREVAPIAADALARLKRAQPAARAWLLAHPATAVAGLVPAAVGEKGASRDAAENALRFLAREGHESVVMEIAARFGAEVSAAVRAVLDFDARQLFPARMPKLPDFAVPSALPRPVLRESGHAVPASSMEHVLLMLAISRADAPYEGVRDLKAACTPESLASLGWELFQAWLVAGANSKEGWAFTQLGVLGDDECARKLAALVRVWPGEAAHARAVTGLDVLAAIGTDVALMHLHGIAQKLKFKGLQEKAREKIDAIAEARGLSADELADRLVPDLDLDDDGTMILEFGARRFRVAFDEALKPFVKDEANARLGDLPKPKKDDDAEKAKVATDAWKALKKDAKTIATQQVTRLELAMCNRRRWTDEVFRRFLVEHPLVRHLVVRIVWGTYDERDALVRMFRVAEDGTFADANDEAWTLPEGARVGVAHALEMKPEEAARFAQTLADYEILQPFKQLGRETYALTEEEKKASTVQRWEGRELPTGNVLGLDGRGWRRGQAQDGGVIGWFEREVSVGPSETVMITLDIEPGVIAGAAMEWKTQKLHGVGIGHDWRWNKQQPQKTLGQLHPILASEILRDVEQLLLSAT